MARDTGPRAQKRPAQPNTTAEEFWATDEGQWIEQQFQRLQNDETTFEKVQEEYAKKFGQPDMAAPSPPSLYAPVPDLKWPTR